MTPHNRLGSMQRLQFYQRMLRQAIEGLPPDRKRFNEKGHHANMRFRN